MAIKVLISPQKYVQGPGAVARLGDHLAPFGIKNPLLLASPSALKAVKDDITGSLKAKGVSHAFTEFGRACTWAEIYRVRDRCLQGGHDAIISCGGGTAMDTGRAAAAGPAFSTSPPKGFEQLGANVPYIQIPTIAATDAATASTSVVYDERGAWVTFVLVRRNPAMVLADTRVIARAPVRTLVSGLGDALTTFFEMDACRRSGAGNLAGGQATLTARMMARLCLDTIMDYGPRAILENEAGIPGPALEAVVEANILLSGLGYENGGVSAAHGLAASFTNFHGLFNPEPLHGELAAFSTLIQLIMEDKDTEIIDEVFEFCRTVGLPVTLAELGLADVTDEALLKIAEDASRGLLIRSMPRASAAPDAEGRYYDAREIFDCLKAADACGRAMR